MGFDGITGRHIENVAHPELIFDGYKKEMRAGIDASFPLIDSSEK